MNVDELFVYSRGLSVLFVEDDPIVSESTAKIINKFYKDVKVCASGVEAFEEYKKYNYDIVITDLNMEKMGGVELIQEIKKIKPQQSILVLSGFIDDFASQLHELDISAVMLKPYRLSKLLYTLLKISENVTIMKEFLLKNDIENLPKKISADTFLNNFSQDECVKDKVELEIEQLLLLSDQIEKIIEKMLKNKNNEVYIDTLSDITHKISNCLANFKEFKIIRETLDEFSHYLLYDMKSHNKSEQVYLMIECLCVDVKSFIDNMFVIKDVSDINYFNDSFKNNFELLKAEAGLVAKNTNSAIIFL